MERQYKDSGLKWIGKIPDTWKVDRFKNKFKTGKGLNITKGDLVQEGIPIVSYGQIHSKQNTGTHLDDFLIRYIPSRLAEEGVSSKVSVGDFIFADTSEDIDGCGNAVYVDKEIGLYAGYHSVIAFAKHPEQSKYFAYLFLTECWRSQIRMRVTGIKVFSISQAILNETTIILPPIAEQQRIVDYLDEKCGEIDRLIALQEQMIERLTNYKKSVINDTVTKGLNPNVQFVPSGIDWIGCIPKGWNVKRVKWILRERKRYSEDGTEEPLSMSQKYGLIPTRDMDIIPNMASSFVGAKLVYTGDLVFNKLKAHLGVFAVSSYNGLVSPDYAVYYKRDNSSMKYLEYLFKTPQYIAEFKKSSTGVGAGLTRLYTDDLFAINCIFPPIAEQLAIAEYLDTKCGEIDRLIETKRQKIETLKEYKKSVIYDAVTGKTDLWDS